MTFHLHTYKICFKKCRIDMKVGGVGELRLGKHMVVWTSIILNKADKQLTCSSSPIIHLCISVGTWVWKQCRRAWIYGSWHRKHSHCEENQEEEILYDHQFDLNEWATVEPALKTCARPPHCPISCDPRFGNLNPSTESIPTRTRVRLSCWTWPQSSRHTLKRGLRMHIYCV